MHAASRFFNMFENSHMIQVYPSEHIIWKGEEWSRIKCMVKVNEYFRTSFTSPKPKYGLRVLLENVSTNEVFSTWKHKLFFRISFHDDTVEGEEGDIDSNSRMIKLIAQNPYMDMTIEVHKALFKAGDKFRIVVAAMNATQIQPTSLKDAVFGASKEIVYVEYSYTNCSSLFYRFLLTILLSCQYQRVTNLKLKVDETFSKHQRIAKVSDYMYVYYNKMGELGNGLTLLIHILDENGEPYKVQNDLLLSSELIYEDFLPVPILPFAKKRNQSHTSSRKNLSLKEKEIFIRMKGEPLIRRGEYSTTFNFHLDDVTYHHHGHDGYKIKFSVPQTNRFCVYPGIMSEVIAVLSKPKKIYMNNPSSVSKAKHLLKIEDIQSEDDRCSPIIKYSTPTVLVEDGEWNEKLQVMRSSIKETPNKRKADDISIEEELKVRFIENTCNDNKVSVPMHAIYDSFICNGSCFTCQATVTAQTILIPTSHFIGCKLAVKVLPFLQKAAISFPVQIANDFSAPSTPLPNIVTSKSFEEGGHVLESIDESIFEDSENQPPKSFSNSSKNSTKKKGSMRSIENELFSQNISKIHVSEHPASSSNIPDDKLVLENILSSNFDTDSNNLEGMYDPYNEEVALTLLDFANNMNVKVGDTMQNSANETDNYHD